MLIALDKTIGWFELILDQSIVRFELNYRDKYELNYFIPLDVVNILLMNVHMPNWVRRAFKVKKVRTSKKEWGLVPEKTRKKNLK